MGGKVGFYAKHILPRVIDLAMRNKDTTRLRKIWIPHARGEVLEIGIGSGRNLPFYPAAVQHVYGVDPSIELQQLAREQVGKTHAKVEFFTQSAEARLPLSDASVDTVVSTWTLCSIPNVVEALREMKRVLKPEGTFIFVEHGRAPEARVCALQNRLTPIWKRFTGGCHLNRKIDELIANAGLKISELKTCYLPGPRPMTFTYQGFAIRP
jgi:ubiquinone/menaquinone biosynthesis C-methylase UbiE